MALIIFSLSSLLFLQCCVVSIPLLGIIPSPLFFVINSWLDVGVGVALLAFVPLCLGIFDVVSNSDR